MENKRFKQGLVALLAAGAMTILPSLSGCDYNSKTPDIYQRIDASNYSSENKQRFKEGYKTLDIKETENQLKEMGINPKDIKKLDKKQRKKMAIEFNKNVAEANFIDPNNVSYKDILFMYELEIGVAGSALMQSN